LTYYGELDRERIAVASPGGLGGRHLVSSPCCLPLIPGYLSYISGVPVSGLGAREARAVTLRAAAAFVAGFTFVFTVLGISFTIVPSALLRNLPLIMRVAGFGIVPWASP
jgi:cytochrome c-type biogenesis protein